MKPVILTGLRANNDLHIGNYFGALLPLIDMAKHHADDYQINLFVPDLHSFTTPIDHAQLQAQIIHNLRLFVAAGLPLDHPDIYIYRQSYIPAHSELTWILDCFTSFGEMGRMTQFKDKAGIQALDSRESQLYLELEPLMAKLAETANFTSITTRGDAPITIDALKEIDPALDTVRITNELLGLHIARQKKAEQVSVGLFNYPVLMAADILLYNASYVPVGDDQTQHLEFTRDIGMRLNTRFNQELFTIPKPVQEQHEFFGKDQGLRIKDLADPTKKMSKSDESARGIVFLGDDPAEAAKKIVSATTDSEGVIRLDYHKQPGISNLLQMQSLLLNQPLGETVRHWEGKNSYGDLKNAVAELAFDFLTGFQQRLQAVDTDELMRKLQADETAMNEVADATLLRVQQAVGLRPPSDA